MIVLSLGGGVQSTTVLLMMEHGELPKADFAIFADTGWESRATYTHLDWLENQTTIPIVRVQQGNIFKDVLAGILPSARSPQARFASMPLYVVEHGKVGMLRRQCTEEYKLKPLRRYIRAELAKRGERVAQVALGISLDEVFRLRDSEVRYIEHWYPLIEKRMRRSDCEAWLRKHGYPIPPKSSCLGCPFHSTEYWRELKRSSPEEFAQVVKLDAKIRHLPRIRGECYLHRSMKPIAEAVDDSQQELYFEECTGYCHT